MNELYHYGVKGMKWGHRKKIYSENSVEGRRAAYKEAKKEYNKAFNEAYNKSIAAYSPIKKHRRNNDERWNNAADKAKKANEAKTAYKTAKKTVKTNEKQQGRLEDAYSYKKKVKEKDLQKTYGSLEDALSYSKYGNKKANAYVNKALTELDRQMKSGETKNYDMKKVNTFIDEALKSIDDDLKRYR